MTNNVIMRVISFFIKNFIIPSCVYRFLFCCYFLVTVHGQALLEPKVP